MGKLCSLFGKSRQAFYDAQNRYPDEDIQTGLIIQEVKKTRQTMQGAGGKTLHNLFKSNELLQAVLPGRDGFYDLLRDNGLLIKKRRKWVITTDSHHPYHIWSDLTKGLEINGRDQLWVSDITYLRLKAGHAIYH